MFNVIAFFSALFPHTPSISAYLFSERSNKKQSSVNYFEKRKKRRKKGSREKGTGRERERAGAVKKAKFYAVITFTWSWKWKIVLTAVPCSEKLRIFSRCILVVCASAFSDPSSRCHTAVCGQHFQRLCVCVFFLLLHFPFLCLIVSENVVKTRKKSCVFSRSLSIDYYIHVVDNIETEAQQISWKNTRTHQSWRVTDERARMLRE